MPNPNGKPLLYVVHTLPIYQWGNSVVMPLYKGWREAIGAHVGDLLIARLHPPYITIRVAHPERLIPIGTFGPEVLPPSWPGKDDNATTPDDPEEPARAPRLPHAREHH